MHRNVSNGIVISVMLLLSPATSESIVIRHDRTDSSHIELGARYDAAITIKPDGMGTLVDREWVLTAAHVVAGSIRRGQMAVEVGDQLIRVDRGYVHPDWDRTGPHDIGLLRLAEPIKQVAPVAMYTGADETGSIVTFVGSGDFGTGLTGPTAGPGTRRGATNTIDSVDNNWVFFTFDSSASATELEGVSGPGDSGGPAFLERDGKIFVAGVSVASVGDAGPGHYGITELYARVATHHEWLMSVMRGESENAALVVGNNDAGGSETQSRSVDVSRGTPQPPPATPQGSLISAFLTAYNTGVDSIMAMFIKARFAPEYVAEKELSGHLDTYHTLYQTHFGRLSFEEVVEAETNLITFRCASQNGPIAELQFTTSEDRKPKIKAIRAAIVSFD